jgi:23S rRNA pseudouridine2605 synthase
MSAIRLQKILSMSGVASRRAAETLITQGRVTVNGRTVTALGSKADPAADDIRVDGRRMKVAEARRYLLLHKPRGYVTTRSDPSRRRTVIDLLQGVREYVYPVGRLDYDSDGLLLLTNDGGLAAALTHPRHGIEREYHAWVLGEPDRHDLERLARGVSIDGRRTMPASVRSIDEGRGRRAGQTLLAITIREGRNRQVRKMCEAIGHPVESLTRVRIGPLSDPKLRPGQFRDLTPGELRRVKASVTKTASEAGAPRATPGARRGAGRGGKMPGQQGAEKGHPG